MKRFHGIKLTRVTTLTVCLLLTGLTTLHTLQAQISYGGAPLGIQAERQSSIGTFVDYMNDMPPINVDSLLKIDALPGNRIGGLKFAHTFFTNLTPENSGVTFTTPDGIKVWKVGIRSRGAQSLNVLFSTFNIPDGASVFLYNKDMSSVLGAFTSKNKPDGGELSVAPVEGEELIIEYQEPEDVAFPGRLAITEVNHDYLGLFRIGTRFNTLNLPCLPDVSCDSTYDELSRSTCLLIINGNTYCTGTLLNNTDQDGTPYILTASHCLQNNPALGSRVVVFMNYRSPRCRPDIRGSEEFSVSGSKTRALSNEIDFALLELDQLPPSDYRPYLAGWTTDTTLRDEPYVCLHHPSGEGMKYAVEADAPIPESWADNNDGIHPNNHWLVKKWETGHTWNGSSGAALFDGNNRLIGAMTGGNSGGESGCGTLYYGDLFFRFDRAWDYFPDSAKQLKHWLAPGLEDTREAIHLDGLDPFAVNPAKRLSTLHPTDSLGALMVSSGRGSLVGQNSFGTHIYAEHFTTDSASTLLGLYLMVYKGTFNTKSPVTIAIYEGGDRPGRVLEQADISFSYKDFVSGRFIRVDKTHFSHSENYFKFTKPVRVGSDFYVGYRVDKTISSKNDSFYVYAALNRQTDVNSAWLYKGDEWYPFSEHPYQPVNTALWIEPIVTNDTLRGQHIGEDSTATPGPPEPTIYYLSNSGKAVIVFPENWKTEVTADIYDITGIRIFTQKGMPPMLTLDFDPTRNRLYLVRVQASGISATLKLLLP